jgi:hypothetical protein
MQAAVRPYLTAGITLIGASVIAVAPIAPPLPEIEVPAVRSEAVTLTASALPAYAELLNNTLTNTGVLANDLFEEGIAPILRQIVVNQLTNVQGLASALHDSLEASNPFGLPALLQTALNQLASGQIQAATETIASGAIQLAFPFLPSLLAPLNNFVAVVDLLPDIALLGGIGAISPPLALLQSTGAAAQAVAGAIGGGDISAAINAIIAAPAVMLDGLLNGYAPTQTGGLLTPSLGTVSILINIRDMILNAITPTAMAATATTTDAVTATTTEAARTVTLDIAPATTEPEDAGGSGTATTDAVEATEKATVDVDATETAADEGTGATADTKADAAVEDATEDADATTADAGTKADADAKAGDDTTRAGSDTKSGTDAQSASDTKSGTDTKSDSDSKSGESDSSASE